MSGVRSRVEESSHESWVASRSPRGYSEEISELVGRDAKIVEDGRECLRRDRFPSVHRYHDPGAVRFTAVNGVTSFLPIERKPETLDHADEIVRGNDRSAWPQTETSTGRKIRSSEGIGSP